MNLGQLIKQKRKEKGLTQTDVANVIGVSTNTVSKYERNIIENMGKEKVLKLSKLLDIPTSYFIDDRFYDETMDAYNIGLVLKEVAKKKQLTCEDFLSEMNDLIDKHLNVNNNERNEITNYLEYMYKRINDNNNNNDYGRNKE